MKELTCQKCGHIWISIKGDPKVCPRCKSYSWGEPTTTYNKEPKTMKDTPNVLTRPIRRMPKEPTLGKKRGELSADDYI